MLIRLKSGFEAAVSDEHMASHWVATFAWEALLRRVATEIVTST